MQGGQGDGGAADGHEHVGVLRVPGRLSPEEKPRAAPPLVECDAAGNFIQAWGGPGQGYDWPNSEHGVYVDPKGFVWIGGNGEKDNQIIKFTKAGKFVMQIGRAGQSKGNADTQNLNQPAHTFVYATTNELFVADGYGHRRVIVFGPDPGPFRRLWGAFGTVATDAARSPATALPPGGGGTPSTEIEPESIPSKRLIARQRVDLPDPEGPITTTTSPASMLKSMSRRTCSSPKCLLTPTSSTSGRAVPLAPSLTGDCDFMPVTIRGSQGRRTCIRWGLSHRYQTLTCPS